MTKFDILYLVLSLAIGLELSKFIYLVYRTFVLKHIMTVKSKKEAKVLLRGRFISTYNKLVGTADIAKWVHLAVLVALTIGIGVVLKNNMVTGVVIAGALIIVFLTVIKATYEIAGFNHDFDKYKFLAELVSLGAEIGRAEHEGLLSESYLSTMRTAYMKIYDRADANEEINKLRKRLRGAFRMLEKLKDTGLEEEDDESGIEDLEEYYEKSYGSHGNRE